MKRISGRLYLLLALVAAYYFTSLFFELSFEFRGAPWPELTDGTAKTPFQYRALVPWIVSMVSRLYPDGERLAACRHLYFWTTCATVFALVLSLKRYLSNFLEDRLARLERRQPREGAPRLFAREGPLSVGAVQLGRGGEQLEEAEGADHQDRRGDHELDEREAGGGRVATRRASPVKGHHDVVLGRMSHGAAETSPSGEGRPRMPRHRPIRDTAPMVRR